MSGSEQNTGGSGTSPTTAQLRQFVAVVEALFRFEAQHYDIRGWGVDAQRPDPDVQAVLDWLRKRSGQPSDEPSLTATSAELFAELGSPDPEREARAVEAIVRRGEMRDPGGKTDDE